MHLSTVMAGLVPAIHVCLLRRRRQDVDARDKRGHDDLLRHGDAQERRALIAIAAIAVGWSGYADAQSPSCAGVQKPRQVAELLFGRKIGDRLGVSQRDFARFVDREISPRFPDGLTVLDAAGEWNDTARKTIVHEPSKLVEIILPGQADDLDRLDRIAEAYKRQFRQQSVAIVTREACVSF